MQDERELRIEEVVQPVLRDHGLTLVDLEWRPHRPRGVLRLYVDKPGGVGIEDCQRASRELGDLLDAANLIEEGYDLEVSSPGLDRQLRKDREFRWALGKRVQCWVAGGEEFRGRLVDVDAARLTLERDGERLDLPRERVTKAKLEAEVPWPRRPAGL
ncbi:MAG TPA: ribosome maturation factor RimP [Methylomirabilota bacterium]|nr:ribosome maturation factor RimP [Methylomirabilota bacterium]